MGLATLLLEGAAQHQPERFWAAIAEARASDVEDVLRLARHPQARVRKDAVNALPHLTHGDPPTPEMVDLVVELTRDVDRHVRDYACFVLSEQWQEVDTPAVREALAARLDDIDREARSQALVGLAYRQDPRALPRLREALSRPSGDLWRLEIVAAGAMSDPSLHDLVVRHRYGWESPAGAEAAELAVRLTDPRGLGDVLDGVADFMRRRARDPLDDSALRWWHLLLDLLDIAPRRTSELTEQVLARLTGDEAAQELTHQLLDP
jgi:HEAT repeat protein